MGKDQIRIAVQFRRLEEDLSQLKKCLKSPDLSDEDRTIYEKKIQSVEVIFEFLHLVLDKASARKKKLLLLCLSGQGGTTNDASEVHYNSVDTMDKARIRMMDRLQRTVLNEEKIEALLKSTTNEEVDEIRQWFTMHVYHNKRLISYLVD
ncbi:hypothetical protein [Paenibacillus piri]|uniref:Uncharacterized protein n=1 Tax=Paenibacillus piri TaxID=2547395 RepID=A0A4R5L060_9BACL|nr:hypothetical protein [Paenibacillus piri]TDG00876.1 hypothetical protein E1757_04500 [Paenibacillus piri]